MFRSIRIARLALSVCALALGACATPPEDLNAPSSPFNPGGAGGGGYGSGSGSGAGTTTLPPSGPPMCDEAYRRCASEFVYAGAPGDKSVEVRGDYRDGGWTSGDALTFDGTQWRGSVALPWNKTIQYKFRVIHSNDAEEWLVDPSNPNTVSDTFGGFNSTRSGVTCTAWTCASTQIVCPGSQATGAAGEFDWRDSVIYFVLVDRFANGNATNDQSIANVESAANWQGGDWAGVTQKINAGYFESLGVNTLWLSVPMESATSAGLGTEPNPHYYSGYHGYWPRDLWQPEPRYGSDDDLKALVAAAHAHGLYILIDYAMNHVHIDSPIYQQHVGDGWFNPQQVSGQDCVCGSNVCGWDAAMKTCWFTNYLPDFNYNNAAARTYSLDNMLWWANEFDVDGFRLDAIKHVELSWLTEARARLITERESVSKRHTYLVGETFTGDAGLIKSFVDPCQKLDGQFDFPLRTVVNAAILMRQSSMRDLAMFMDSNDSFYGNSVMSTFIGNHDVPRSIHFAEDAPRWNDVWAGGREISWSNQPGQPSSLSAYERMGVAMAVLETTRGAPLIYYGDEVGLAGAGDPDNRRFMPWSGYSAGQSWLLERMKKLGTIRAAHPALRRGDRTTLWVDDEAWVYRMSEGSDEVYVAINRSDSAKTVSNLPARAFNELLTSTTVSGPNLQIPPRGAVILAP